MNKKYGFAFGYVQGLYGPYGLINGGTAAHSGSYYEMHVENLVVCIYMMLHVAVNLSFLVTNYN